MIKDVKVLVKINSRNSNYYKSLGYETTEDCEVLVSDLPNGSKVRITSICEICGSENNISYNKYLFNKNRNNKGYYSCFKCKNIEKEKTCILKYGETSYSKTDEFKISESIKWKGIQKGSEKGKKTMIEKYGVDSYFKTDESKEYNRTWMSSKEFKDKSKETILEKYGVDSYSKTEQFKLDIESKKDLILEKIKLTFLDKYGVDWISKSKIWKDIYNLKTDDIENKKRITCLSRYGVDNVSKDVEIYKKILMTKISKGQIVSDDKLSSWDLYRRKVKNITSKVKKQLYEEWDGYDYYDNELIKGYSSYSFTHRFYPTIDHKISTFFGFINSIDPNDIGCLSNLCITKRYINCQKNRLIEDVFLNL